MGACLARLAITVPEEKLEQVARSRHLVQRQSDRLGVDRASGGNRFTVFPAALDVKPHRFQNAALRFFDGLSEAVDAWKVVAVSVVMLSFPLNCNRIAVNSHLVDVSAEELAAQLWLSGRNGRERGRLGEECNGRKMKKARTADAERAFFGFILAATYVPTPLPAQYHRPCGA